MGKLLVQAAESMRVFAGPELELEAEAGAGTITSRP